MMRLVNRLRGARVGFFTKVHHKPIYDRTSSSSHLFALQNLQCVPRVTPPFSRGTPHIRNYSTYWEDPEFIDWRRKNAVTEVKDQGKTCFCKAFTSAEAAEGIHYLDTGELVPLSPQHLIDCVLGYTCDKKDHKNCDMEGAHLLYEIQEHGIMTLEDYPLEDNRGECREKEGRRISFEDVGCVEPGDEEEMLRVLAIVPLYALMYTDTPAFDEYTWESEIYDVKMEKGQKFDHSVLIIGHEIDEKTGKKCWIIKNCYGKKWGRDGFMQVLRDGSYEGVGGINLEVWYPIMYELGKNRK